MRGFTCFLLFIFIYPLNFVSIRSSADLTLFLRMVNMQAFRSLLLLLAPGVVNGAAVVNGECLFVSFLLVWLRVLAQQTDCLVRNTPRSMRCPNKISYDDCP